jgi:hypothetical protein
MLLLFILNICKDYYQQRFSTNQSLFVDLFFTASSLTYKKKKLECQLRLLCLNKLKEASSLANNDNATVIKKVIVIK